MKEILKSLEQEAKSPKHVKLEPTPIPEFENGYYRLTRLEWDGIVKKLITLTRVFNNQKQVLKQLETFRDVLEAYGGTIQGGMGLHSKLLNVIYETNETLR